MQTHMMQAVLDPAHGRAGPLHGRGRSSSATGVDRPSPAAVSADWSSRPQPSSSACEPARAGVAQRFRRAEISAPLRAAAIRSGCFSATAPSALVAVSTASRSTASAWSNSSASGIASKVALRPGSLSSGAQTSRSSRARFPGGG